MMMMMMMMMMMLMLMLMLMLIVLLWCCGWDHVYDADDDDDAADDDDGDDDDDDDDDDGENNDDDNDFRVLLDFGHLGHSIFRSISGWPRWIADQAGRAHGSHCHRRVEAHNHHADQGQRTV